MTATLSATDNVACNRLSADRKFRQTFSAAAGWKSASPVSYTFASAGAKTLYAWAKDGAGNISASLSANVTITVSSSSGAADISTASYLNLGRVKVKESVKKTLTVSNKGTVKLVVSKVDVAGDGASVFKPSASAFNVVPSETYDLKIEFKPTARRTYNATLRIYSNDPDTPVKNIALSGSGR